MCYASQNTHIMDNVDSELNLIISPPPRNTRLRQRKGLRRLWQVNVRLVISEYEIVAVDIGFIKIYSNGRLELASK